MEKVNEYAKNISL